VYFCACEDGFVDSRSGESVVVVVGLLPVGGEVLLLLFLLGLRSSVIGVVVDR
jgi:hypothetical protein